MACDSYRQAVSSVQLCKCRKLVGRLHAREWGQLSCYQDVQMIYMISYSFWRCSEMSCKNQLAVAPCSGVQVLMMTAPLGFSTRCTSFKKVPTLAKPEEPFGWRCWITCHKARKYHCHHPCVSSTKSKTFQTQSTKKLYNWSSYSSLVDVSTHSIEVQEYCTMNTHQTPWYKSTITAQFILSVFFTWSQMTPSNCWSEKGKERTFPMCTCTLSRWAVFCLACFTIPSLQSTPVIFPTNILTATK